MANFIGLVISSVFGIVLTLIYWAVIWWLDRFEKEPLWLLLSAFIWGAAVAPVLSIVVELVMAGTASVFVSGAPLEFATASGIAPLVEEAFKGAGVLLIALIFKREFDDAMDGLVYGATVGLGFALSENILYFIGGFAGGTPVLLLFFLRSVVFGLTHALFTGVFGLSVGLAKVNRNLALKVLFLVVGFSVAVAMHASHNALLTLLSGPGMLASLTFYIITIAILLLVAFIALYYEKTWISRQLVEELRNGYITQEMYDRASSWSGASKELHVLFTRGWGEYLRLKNRRHLLAKLALRKKGFQRTGNPEYLRSVERLREKLRRMAN